MLKKITYGRPRCGSGKFIQWMELATGLEYYFRTTYPGHFLRYPASQYPNPGLNIPAGVNYPDKKVPIPDTPGYPFTTPLGHGVPKQLRAQHH
jgi:hypothetical protein